MNKPLLLTFLMLFFLEAAPMYTYKQTFNYINMQLNILRDNYGYSTKELWPVSRAIRYYVFFVPTSRRIIKDKYFWDLDVVDSIIDREIIKLTQPDEYEWYSMKWLH